MRNDAIESSSEARIRRGISGWLAIAALLAGPALAQETASFMTDDGGRIHAQLYGTGARGVVLAHGGQFNKESWNPQARALADAGFRVLALDFRGYGDSIGPGQQDPISAPLHLDVLAAVRYLRAAGATSVAVVGASLGGMAAGDAARHANPGEIDRIVFLASGTTLQEGTAPPIPVRTLFIVARDDADGAGTLRLPGIRADYDRATEPKRLIVIGGSAHAQALFAAPEAEDVLAEILEFLSAP
jgi:alpha/beta superfamily hydrolase